MSNIEPCQYYAWNGKCLIVNDYFNCDGCKEDCACPQALAEAVKKAIIDKLADEQFEERRLKDVK